MEPEEIAVVLSRASELHSKLRDAIAGCAEERPSPSSRIPGLQNGDFSAEPRSLAAIRDSLEVLEEQLESFQTLQQQQRVDRDAGLADIEESRRLFLKRLKEYRGRDSKIVQEALAFAGGNVPDKYELTAQGYPPSEDGDSSYFPFVSIPRGRYDSAERQELQEEQRSRNQMFGFEVEEQQEDDGSDEGTGFEDENCMDSDNPIRAAARSLNASKNSLISSKAFTFTYNAVRNSVAFLNRVLGQISQQVTGPPSKAMLIVVSTLVVLSLTDLRERRAKSVARLSRMPAHRSHQRHIRNVTPKRDARMMSSKTSNNGRKSGSFNKRANYSAESNAFAAGRDPRSLDDEFPTCVVRERLELPFYQELLTQDVLRGQG